MAEEETTRDRLGDALQARVDGARLLENPFIHVRWHVAHEALEAFERGGHPIAAAKAACARYYGAQGATALDEARHIEATVTSILKTAV